MPTGGTQVLTTTETTLFDAGSGGRAAAATSVRVTADSANTDNVLVRVDGLHVVGEEDPLAKGEEGIYRVGENGLRVINAKAASGSQTVRFGVRAKTAPAAT